MKSTGLGHLFQRGKDSNGKPCGNYSLQYNLNGSRKIVGLGTDDLAKAERKRKELLDEALSLNTKEKVIVHIAENRKLMNPIKHSLDDVWDKFKSSQARPDSSSGTLGNYERNWEKFRKWLKTAHPKLERINQITRLEAEAYMAKIWSGGMAPATFNYHLHSLKHIFKTVCGAFDNPFEKIQQKRLEHDASRKPFTLAQVNMILAAFDNPELLKMDIMHQDEMKTLFFLGAYTGARLIDCALMKRESIDLAQRTISYVPIKTKRINRRVTISIDSNAFYNHLADCLKDHSKSEYLLPDVSGRYIKNKDGVVNDSIKVFAFCGIRDMKDRTPKSERVLVKTKGKQRLNVKVVYGFHSFRHFVGTSLASMGVPIKTLADMLGDDVTTASKYYIHVSDGEKQRAMKLLMQDDLKYGETVIDVEEVSDMDMLKESLKTALEAIKTAKETDLSESFRAHLLDILKAV
ncbi:MAG: tyrosine-type recombinase/integrase [Victivallales bacterium]|jgi:integrase